MDFFNKFLSRDPETEEVTFDQKDQLERQVAVLFNVLSTVVGAEQVILLADSSKLGSPSLAGSGNIGDIDVIITDNNVSPELVAKLAKKHIEVIRTGNAPEKI